VICWILRDIHFKGMTRHVNTVSQNILLYVSHTHYHKHHKKWKLICVAATNHISSQMFVMSVTYKPRSHCPSVRRGASRQFVAGGLGTNRGGFQFVHTFPTVLRPDPVWCKTWSQSVPLMVRSGQNFNKHGINITFSWISIRRLVLKSLNLNSLKLIFSATPHRIVANCVL